MGIYCYTLRKSTIKAVDMDINAPIEIGVTKYAYKESFWSESKAYKMLTARSHAAAERARNANPNLVLITHGDPKDHDFDRYGAMDVRRVTPDLEYFMDSKLPGEVVGKLYKVGKKFEFERLSA